MSEYYSKKCKCGCNGLIEIKPWHTYKGHKIPEYIQGHWAKVNPPMKNPETRKKVSEALKDQKFSEDRKRNISEALKGKCCDSENGNWKGGTQGYWHVKAGKLFRKDHCEKCRITNEESLKVYGRRLDMHCTSIPKDYNDISPGNWQTLCVKCHKEKEDKIKNV